MVTGKSVKRVDAFDKVTGRTRYTDDLCDKKAYIARVLHATVANGKVISFDTSEAEKVPGVVKILTCFDLKEKHYFPTAGHPWSTDPNHQDVADRLILTDRVRFYGDDIAAVVAEDEVAAAQALRLIRVEYEEYPFVLDVQKAMEDGAPQLHENFPNNILKHTQIRSGDLAKAIQEPGLTKVEGWYETPVVQHCHIENFICFAEMEGGRITVTTSTQIPHIVRRVVGQALGMDWGKIRVIKPYIGGGFGNKQDVLYEPLCAWLCLQTGGHLVKLDVPREETFVCNRTRHSIRNHIISWVRPDGTYAARKLEAFSDQGAYASHGHSICAKGAGAFPQLYPCENVEVDAYTVFTNKPVAGAMRGYGIPQAMWAVESHTEDVCAAIGADPLEFRRRNLMPVGYTDGFSKNENYYDSFNQCLNKAMKAIDYERKFREYEKQNADLLHPERREQTALHASETSSSGKTPETDSKLSEPRSGDIRRGIGLSVFWYNTAVWPISLESTSCRMVLNQDGSFQLQLGETEIGQGADTAFAQMAADVVGVPLENVHVVSCQDTDVTPFGTSAYASRQTYVAGFSIRQTGLLFKERILNYAHELTRMPVFNLDIVDGNIVRSTDGRVLMTLGELATEALYSLTASQHITAESTYQVKSNAYSFGCTIAEVEVDIPMCRAKLLNVVNCHDAGKLINPALAEAQVHGGMSMGIGFGMSEKLLFDEKTGRPLNNNLLDYKLSTFLDHPTLQAEFVENPEPTSAFGTKGLGEPPACSVAPAIRNAIFHATGVGIKDAPANPHNLFKAFKEAGLIDCVILSLSRAVRESCDCSSAVRVRIIAAKDLSGACCNWHHNTLASIAPSNRARQGPKQEEPTMYDIKALYEAESVEDAVRLLQEHPEAQIIAGGSDVLVQIREGKRAGKELGQTRRQGTGEHLRHRRDARRDPRRRRRDPHRLPDQFLPHRRVPDHPGVHPGAGRGGQPRGRPPDPEHRHHRRQHLQRCDQRRLRVHAGGLGRRRGADRPGGRPQGPASGILHQSRQGGPAAGRDPDCHPHPQSRL